MLLFWMLYVRLFVGSLFNPTVSYRYCKGIIIRLDHKMDCVEITLFTQVEVVGTWIVFCDNKKTYGPLLDFARNTVPFLYMPIIQTLKNLNETLAERIESANSYKVMSIVV